MPRTRTKSTSKVKADGSIIVSVSFTKDTFKRLESMRKAKGLNNEQELIRVLVGDRLDNAGY